MRQEHAVGPRRAFSYINEKHHASHCLGHAEPSPHEKHSNTQQKTKAQDVTPGDGVCVPALLTPSRGAVHGLPGLSFLCRNDSKSSQTWSRPSLLNLQTRASGEARI